MLSTEPRSTAQIGSEQPRGDRVAGIRHHGQRDNWQHSLQQHDVVITKARCAVGRKGIANPSSTRRITIRAKANDLGEIIGGTGGGELLELRKIELRRGSAEASAQIQPRIRRFGRGRRRSCFAEPDQVADRAVEHALLVFVAAFELRGLNGVEAAPPSVAIAAPLWMQGLHPGESAPQRHAGADEAPTEAVEQGFGVRPTQTLTDGPDVHFDDLLPERAVEAQRQRRHLRGARPVKHERRLYPNLSQMRNRLVGDDVFVTSVEPSLMIDRWR